MRRLDIVIFGLSITSSWGNGHATTFRSLLKALARRGHRVTFFERDVPWYSAHRDLADPPFCQVVLYRSVPELARWRETISQAELVILGSYVPEAERCAAFIRRLEPGCFAFYDIDTPVTLAKLDRGDFEYLHPRMIPEFDMYLSFTGGPLLARLEIHYGARRALPLYCSVDTDLYYPLERDGEAEILLGYLGTYSADRQPTLDELLVRPARNMPERRFCVAGAQYPPRLQWPDNVTLVSHIPPADHCLFYNGQRFTLNVTRADMIAAGYSPSVRLFEAGACGVPVISDEWPGLDSFFRIGQEILVARSAAEVQDLLAMDEDRRRQIATRYRERVLNAHTSRHRALQLEEYWRHARDNAAARPVGAAFLQG